MGIRVDRQRRIVAVDDFSNNGEAEAGPFAGGTRNPVEALENFAPFAGGYAGSRIHHP